MDRSALESLATSLLVSLEAVAVACKEVLEHGCLIVDSDDAYLIDLVSNEVGGVLDGLHCGRLVCFDGLVGFWKCSSLWIDSRVVV